MHSQKDILDIPAYCSNFMDHSWFDLLFDLFYTFL